MNNKQEIVLLLGDLIIDETHYVDVKRISPEAPVPVAELIKPFPKRTLGGVGIAARYAEKNNIPYALITSVAKENIQLLHGMNYYPIYLDGNNVTKTRLIDKRHKYHIVRIDNDTIADKTSPRIMEIKGYIETIKKTYDIKIVCMLNYSKGFFHHGIVEAIQESTKAPTFVDTGTSFEIFETCDILRMNDVEFNELIKETCMYEKQIHIITKGKEGAIFFPRYEEEQIEVHIDNTIPKGIPDTTGCGDVFDISFCSCMLNSDDIQLNNNKLLEQCVRYAVDSSSEYAYQDFETRLEKHDD